MFRNQFGETLEAFSTANIENYDLLASILEPNYECFHLEFLAAAECLLKTSVDRGDSILVVDLGAGTGRDVVPICEISPRIHYLAIDVSEHALDIASKKASVSELLNQLSIMKSDIRSIDFDQMIGRQSGVEHVLVVSVLALHHLDAQEKKFLYEAISNIEAQQVQFLNADYAAYSNHYLDFSSKEAQIEQIRGGLRSLRDSCSRHVVGNIDDIEKLWIEHYRHVNQQLTLSEELHLLAEARFYSLDVLFRHGQQAIISARLS